MVELWFVISDKVDMVVMVINYNFGFVWVLFIVDKFFYVNDIFKSSICF